jgi:hypothetical protein
MAERRARPHNPKHVIVAAAARTGAYLATAAARPAPGPARATSATGTDGSWLCAAIRAVPGLPAPIGLTRYLAFKRNRHESALGRPMARQRSVLRSQILT